MLRLILILLPILVIGSPETFSEMARHIYERYETLEVNTLWHHELSQAVGEEVVSAEALVKRGVKRKFLDHMALEYVKRHDNLFLVILFPPGPSNPAPARNLLNEAGAVIYEKRLTLTCNGMRNFLRAVYDVHHCDGWREVNSGIYSRFRHLLTGSDQTLHIFLYSCDSLTHSNDTKRIVRRTYDQNNEICHFTDFIDETRHNAHILFSQPTIDFLNIARPKNYETFVRYAKMTKKFSDATPRFQDAYCIDTGGVLAAYGIRNCGDFDLMVKGTFDFPSPEIETDNFTRTKYGTNCDDVIYNPTRHFYYKGLRFANLDDVAHYKKVKNKAKDRADLILIEKFFR